MATVVSFHAHPDDESILTGGMLCRAARQGHRVVLVFATKGEHGEVDDGVLEDEETLGQRREAECAASAAVLGAHRVVFLGYHDSGMIGTPENEAPESFWQAPLEDAAARMAALLTEEAADLLTVYDDNGGYGHPDHIKVHQVGIRAAEIAGTPRVAEATMNRDHLRRVIAAGREAGAVSDDEVPDVGEESTFGKPEAEITTCIDVTDLLDVKRDSMRAHASQIDEQSFFLQMPEEAFAASFGYEWFIRRDREPGGAMDTDLLAGL